MLNRKYFNFDGILEAPFCNYSKMSKFTSFYNKQKNGISKISPSLLRALLFYTDQNEDFLISENDNETVLIAKNIETKNLICVLETNSNEIKIKTLLFDQKSYVNINIEDSQFCWVLFMLLFHKLIQDEEFLNNLNQLSFHLENYNCDESFQIISVLSDNVFQRISQKELDLNYLDNYEINVKGKISSNHIEEILTKIKKNINTNILGNLSLELFMKENKMNKTNNKSINSMFSIIDDASIFSEKEKELIPIMDCDYVTQKEVLEIGYLIKSTIKSEVPNRNILLTGCPSSGKSTAAKAIAATLGLPFVSMNFNEEVSWSDIVGQYAPRIEDQNDLPTLVDIYNDSDNSYRKMLLKEKENKYQSFTREEALFLWEKKQIEKGNQKDFIFTETPFVQAIKNGWVIELQELNALPKNVAINLHMVLEEGILLMPNGEVIQRHPNSIIIATTNPTQSSFQSENDKLGLALLSRFALCYVLNLPPIDVMVERAMRKTNVDNIDLVYEMADIICMINSKLESMGINDGSVDMRSLNSWVENSKFVEDSNGLLSIYQLGINCVINKATQDPSIRHELMVFLDESSFY